MTNKLLSDEELKQECLTIVALQEYGTTPSNLSGEQLAKIGFASVGLYQFINTQKRLYAENRKSAIAVKYMIDVWDEVQGSWRETPDHVQRKFLEAESED